jgi:hypothetical protein
MNEILSVIIRLAVIFVPLLSIIGVLWSLFGSLIAAWDNSEEDKDKFRAPAGSVVGIILAIVAIALDYNPGKIMMSSTEVLPKFDINIWYVYLISLIWGFFIRLFVGSFTFKSKFSGFLCMYVSFSTLLSLYVFYYHPEFRGHQTYATIFKTVGYLLSFVCNAGEFFDELRSIYK